MMFRIFYERCCRLFLELFLEDEEVRRLHDFEEDCVDDYFNTIELQFESSTEERIKATNHR